MLIDKYLHGIRGCSRTSISWHTVFVDQRTTLALVVDLSLSLFGSCWSSPAGEQSYGSCACRARTITEPPEEWMKRVSSLYIDPKIDRQTCKIPFKMYWKAFLIYFGDHYWPSDHYITYIYIYDMTFSCLEYLRFQFSCGGFNALNQPHVHIACMVLAYHNWLRS